MTPKPPSSPDGSSLPPRHRPPLGNLAKDTTEMDLWAFDDLDPLDEISEIKPPKAVIPVPREIDQPTDAKSPATSSGASGTAAESVSVNVNKGVKRARFPNATAGPGNPSSQSKSGSDFDDLDTWEEPVVVTTSMTPMPVMIPDAEPGSLVLEKETVVLPEAVPQVDDKDEFSSKPREIANPVPLAPKLNLSKIERIGLFSLIALLAVAGGVFYFNTINRLPTGIELVKSKDFPISGNKLKILSATTYWREPITSGVKADKVRRDTLLIPVVELASSGGPAAIRVFFRDGDGELIGDAVSRSTQGEMKFQFAATAGFDDLGMHAAYRTGQSEPWTIEVLEAPSEDSPPADFRRIFEMNIATDRR